MTGIIFHGFLIAAAPQVNALQSKIQEFSLPAQALIQTTVEPLL